MRACSFAFSAEPAVLQLGANTEIFYELSGQVKVVACNSTKAPELSGQLKQYIPRADRLPDKGAD